MLLAQITDPHIKADRRRAYGKVDTAAFLEAAIEHVNRFSPAVEAVIVTGDLTDGGEPADYAAVCEILSGLSRPYYVIPGNHDERGNLLAAFSEHDYLSTCEGFVHYSIEDYPIRLVGLDSTLPRKPHGWLCEERLTWLDETLGQQPDRPTFVFQHHPPFQTGIAHMDVQNLHNGSEEIAVLAKHPQVRHVACGHVHRPSETTIEGIGFSIAPNAAHSVTLALQAEAEPSFTLEPPAIRLFWISADGDVTSHLSFIGAFDGPHPFIEMDGSLKD